MTPFSGILSPESSRPDFHGLAEFRSAPHLHRPACDYGDHSNLPDLRPRIGGMEDHVHLLIEIPLTLAHSDAIEEIKTSSLRWMGRDFAWQRGFGLFGVSASNKDAVIRYIHNQETHHRKMTFDQEFIALLEKHGVKYDPRYVFG